jgi:EipB-like
MRANVTSSILACLLTLTGSLAMTGSEALAGAAVAQSAATPVRLIPHRAVYNLSLARSDGGSRGIDTARGRIAFDFGGDACEGYTLNYRQVTVMEGGDTGSRTLDVRTATFEAADGKSMRFKTDSSTDGSPTSNIDGEATRTDGASLSVRVRQPKRETLNLPGDPIFPTEHMKRLIVAAQGGENTLAIKLYDGSDDGRKVYDTLTLIGHKIEPGAGANLEESAKQDALAKSVRWPVTISYFNASSGDQTPAYTISFDLYDNGVSRALKLDYGDFALKGDLQKLEVQPYTSCQR